MIRSKAFSIGLFLSVSILHSINAFVATHDGGMSPARRKVVLFDLGYTVVTPNTSSAISNLGFGNLMRCYFGDYKKQILRTKFKTYLQNFMMETLSKIPSPAVNADPKPMLAPDGKALPTIFKDLMIGAITSQQALDQINTYVKLHPEWFGSDAQKNVFLGMVKFAYDPETFTESLQLNPACTRLLQHCSQQGCLCIVVSNWARECVAEFKQKFCLSVNPYVHEWVFSCDGHGAKPSAPIYEYCYQMVQNKYPEFSTADWYFLDDQEENRIGAKDALRPLFEQNGKMQQIHCAHPDKAERFARKHGLIGDNITRRMLLANINRTEQIAYKHELEKRNIYRTQQAAA